MTRPAARTYKSQVNVQKVSEWVYLVRATPIPLHTAEVSAVVWAGRFRGWRVKLLATGRSRGGEWRFERALHEAAEWVGLLTGEEMRTRFAGVQRSAMGRQKCPYIGPMEGRVKLCLSAPEPGSVWCPDHPNGRKEGD